jgi:hypothetical protein
MSHDKLIVVDGLLIGREHWDVPVRVELRAYLRFSRRLDLQLRRLVVRWAHSASPSARGVPASRVQTGMSVPPT